MLRLNRVSEYALISLAYIHRRQDASHASSISAREIAEAHRLPYEITAKTLQRIKRMGLIDSSQGVNGGYVLARPLSTITLAELLNGLEGEQSVVECANHTALARLGGKMEAGQEALQGARHEALPEAPHEVACCEFQEFCTLQPFMKTLNLKLANLLEEIRLDEILDDNSVINFAELNSELKNKIPRVAQPEVAQ